MTLSRRSGQARASNIGKLIVFWALAAWAAPAPAAEPLGRLFFTPAERTLLDAARSKKTRVNLETETEPTTVDKPPPPPAPEQMTYGGLVRRSDGKTTVWLNNRPLNEKDVRSGTTIVGSVRPDGSVTLQSPQSGRRVELKVGQSAELLTGSVEEGYARRGLTGPKPEAKAEPKPAAKPGAEAGAPSPAAAEREKEARDRQRDLEDATRALQEAAAAARSSGPAPAQPIVVPTQPGSPPAQPGAVPASPAQQPSR